MIPAIKAEFRKLLTVRSTYVISGIAVALVIFVAFYIVGYRLTPAELLNTGKSADDMTSAINVVAIFVALIAVLLMTHEYRYNTIMHTLTSSNSRTKVLVAKIVAVSVYALVFTLFIVILSPTMSRLGIAAHHHTLVPQTIHYGDLLWRSLFFGWGFGMAGLLIAALIRNQVGAIAALFVIPSAIENILGLLLKENVKYLPFTALGNITVGHPGIGSALSYGKDAAVFGAYLVVGWLVAWVLFIKRDAN